MRVANKHNNPPLTVREKENKTKGDVQSNQGSQADFGSTLKRFEACERAKKDRLMKLKNEAAKKTSSQLSPHPKINTHTPDKQRVPLTERINAIIETRLLKSTTIKKQQDEHKNLQELNECTFRPNINKHASHTPEPSSKSQSSISRVDSLMKWGAERNKKMTEALIAQETESKSKSTKKMGTKEIEQSAVRLHTAYIQQEKKKAELQCKEQSSNSFRPMISHKSKQLVQEREARMKALSSIQQAESQGQRTGRYADDQDEEDEEDKQQEKVAMEALGKKIRDASGGVFPSNPPTLLKDLQSWCRDIDSISTLQ